MKGSTLAKMSIKETPMPNANAKEITALIKDNGRVVGYQLNGNEILEKAAAISLAKQGGIKNIGIAVNQGNEYLKSLPDNTESNNLSNLPSISAKDL